MREIRRITIAHFRGKLKGAGFLAKAKRVGTKSTHFIIEVRGADLVVSLLNGKFKATYYKPLGRRNLILRERTKTDDEALVARSISGCGCQGARTGMDCVAVSTAGLLSAKEGLIAGKASVRVFLRPVKDCEAACLCFLRRASSLQPAERRRSMGLRLLSRDEAWSQGWR